MHAVNVRSCMAVMRSQTSLQLMSRIAVQAAPVAALLCIARLQVDLNVGFLCPWVHRVLLKCVSTVQEYTRALQEGLRIVGQ